MSAPDESLEEAQQVCREARGGLVVIGRVQSERRVVLFTPDGHRWEFEPAQAKLMAVQLVDQASAVEA